MFDDSLNNLGSQPKKRFHRPKKSTLFEGKKGATRIGIPLIF